MHGETAKNNTRVKFFIGVVALVVCAFLCFGCSNQTITGTWYFNSMTPSADAVTELSDNEKSEYSQSAESLTMFMSGTSIEFKDEGTVDVAFMNEHYEGTYTQEGDSWSVSMNDEDMSNLSGTYAMKDGKLIFTTKETSNRLFGFDVVFSRDEFKYESEDTSSSASDEDAPVQEIEEGSESEEADHHSGEDGHEHSGEVSDDGAV